MRVRCILGSLFFFCLHVSAQDLLLKNVHLIDPEARTVEVGHLTIHQGRIVSFSKKLPASFSGKSLDLTGRWIVPSFTETHNHSSWGNLSASDRESFGTEETAKRMLYCGVTAFLDLFADEEMIFALRDRQRKSGLPGADIYAAGPMLTCTNGHGTRFGISTRTMDTPEQAKIQVAALAKKKPDVIKIAYDHAREYSSMNEATLKAILQAAGRAHLKTVVHIGTWKDATAAVLSGATVITHLYEEDIPTELVKEMKKRGVWEIPTMAYQTELLHLVENNFLNLPLLGAVTTPEVLEGYRHLQVNSPFFQKMLIEQKTRLPSYQRSLKKLLQAGVRVLTGTDAGGAFAVFQGFSVHREMQLLVESGFSPWEALDASTTAAKKFLGRPSGIHPGEKAEFVVLESSPLDDIRNTQSIERIFFRGAWVDRPSLVSNLKPP